MYLNQQDHLVGPASLLVNAAQRIQQARTVNNCCEYQTFNSAFQPSNNAAIASKNLSQPYQQTHNFQLSATPYLVYSPPQREGLTSNMCPPQVTLPNNQFASTNGQSTNQCFQSTSEMHNRRSHENIYTNWSNPASHYTTSTPLLYKQATFIQPLVPAKKQQSFHNQIQDITQQDIPQLYNGLNHKMANFMSGKDDRNAISSQLSGQFVSCNVPQAQQNPYQCRMSAGSNANKESHSSHSSLQCTSEICALLVKANTVPTNQAVAQQDPSSTVGSNTFADYLSQPPKYTGLHHMVKQSVSQTDVTMSHSKRPMLNSTGPANYFKNSSNSSSLHRENISPQCTKKGISSHGSGNTLVAQAETVGGTKHLHQSRIHGNKLLRHLKKTRLKIPSQTQLPSTNNPDRERLTQSHTCVESNNSYVQASFANLGTKAVAVVPPLSQESSENISKKTSPNKTSEYYEEQEKNISKPDAEVCNISGSSQSDSSSTPKSDDSTTLTLLKQILEFNQNYFSPTQMNVAPEEPVSQNIEQHQSSCQNDTETASTSQHDPPLVETHDSSMSCPVEAQSKQEDPELLILKGEEDSETPYKSSWLNVNEQLDDIDKECGFPWAMRCRPHQERTNEGSTAAESPNHVSKTQLDTDELMNQIEDLLSELLPSPAPVLFESEVDESCYDFKIEVLPSEIAKQIYEQTCREGTLEPNVCVENGVSSSELKLHDGTESLSERVPVLSTPETESELPLSEDSIKIPHHPSVETENSTKGETETDDHTMRSNSSDMDNNVMETNGEKEDGKRTKNSSSEHSDSKEDYAQPLQLNRFDIQRKSEKTYQEVKPLTMFVKKVKNHFLDVFQRKDKLINKRKYGHCQPNQRTSKQLDHHVSQMKKQKKKKKKLKWKTSAADSPSTSEIADKVLQERKPDDGQIENIEDIVDETTTSREENACDQTIELQKPPNVLIEEEYEGPLPVKGVETQIEGEMTNLNSNGRDIQQAVLNCMDGVKPYKVCLDKVHDLSNMGECQNVVRQYNKIEDHDSQNIPDMYHTPVEVVSSQPEEKIDHPCKINKVTEDLKSSNSEEGGDHTMRSTSLDMDEMDDNLMGANGETEDVGFSKRKENSSSEYFDSEEDFAQPLRLNRVGIQRKYEKTSQGLKPLTTVAKNNNFFEVFQRENKLIIKRKCAHCQTKHKTSKQSVFQSKIQEKIKAKLKWKTSAADTPLPSEIADKVLKERKPEDGQIENIEDTVEEAPTSREENGCNQSTELPKNPNLFLEEGCAGPLPVNGVDTQIEGEMTNLNSNERDILQAVLNCKDGVKPYKVFLDKVDNLTSQGECQTVDRQYNKSEDHDSRNVPEKHSSPVEVVSSQHEEKDDIPCKINKVTEDLESFNSEEGAFEAISDSQILVSNPEEESLGSLQSDVLDTKTQSKTTIQDPHNKGVKVDKVLVDKVCHLKTPGSQIVDGKRKRQSCEEAALTFAKEKDQQTEDLQSRKSNDYVSKRERLVDDPPSKFVKLSLFGKSQLRDPNANQTSQKLPKDLFIPVGADHSSPQAVCAVGDGLVNTPHPCFAPSCYPHDLRKSLDELRKEDYLCWRRCHHSLVVRTRSSKRTLQR